MFQGYRFFSCYRPQRSWGKVMFLHVCVILFTGGGSASVHAVIPTPWQGGPSGKETPRQGDAPGKADPPVQCMLEDTVNKRVVCILLECNSCSYLVAQLNKVGNIGILVLQRVCENL